MATDLKIIEIRDFPKTTELAGVGEEIFPVSKGDGKTYGIKSSDLKAFLGTVQSTPPRPIAPSDPTPTLDGVYEPVVDGTYANAGGLVRDTAPGGVDEGMAVQFIKNGSVWVKNTYPLPIQDISGLVKRDDINTVILNLYNSEKGIDGEFVDQNGAINQNSNYSRSAMMILNPLESHLSLRRSTTATVVGCFFDSSGAYINGSSIVAPQGTLTISFPIPAGAHSFVANISNSSSTREYDKSHYTIIYGQKIPDTFIPYNELVDKIESVDIISYNWYPFIKGAKLKIDKNTIDSILSISLNNIDPNKKLYLKQFGRHFSPNPSTLNRWYFEIWGEEGLVIGGFNKSGRISRNEDFLGVERVELFNQQDQSVGYAIINWANAWPSPDGGYWADGTFETSGINKQCFIKSSGAKFRFLKWVSNGDSIMAASNSFVQRAASYMGASLINYAIGGSTVAQNPSDPNGRNPLVIRYTEMEDDADFILIAIGTNDCNYSWTPFGEFTDRRADTFLGAMHMLCEGLKNKYVGKLIVFQTPIKRKQDLPTPESKNAYGKTQKDYADAIKDVCSYWGIPVLDMFSICIINPFIEEYITYLIPDGTHPNSEGHQLMSESLLGFLSTV